MTTNNSDDKKDKLKLAIEKNPCTKCRSQNLTACKCVGGGGGGASKAQDDNDDSAEKQASNSVPMPQNELKLWADPSAAPIFQSPEFNLQLTGDTKLNNFILLFQMGENLLPEQKALLVWQMKEILAEFEDFKDSLEANNISTQGFSAAMNENQLVIQIYSQTHCAQFIEQLNSKNLLPVPTFSRKNEEQDDEAARPFNPSPLSCGS